jgi:hypothetical protein
LVLGVVVTANLEVPRSYEALFDCFNEDPGLARPVMTGDIFKNLETLDGKVNAMVVSHPCTMRGEGGVLGSRILVAKIREHKEIDKADLAENHFSFFPFGTHPVKERKHGVVDFNATYPCTGDSLRDAERVACLNSYGLSVLHQRYVYFLTRVSIKPAEFDAALRSPLLEAELLQDWTEGYLSFNEVEEATWEDVEEAAKQFDEFVTPQMRDDLKTLDDEHHTIDAVRREIESRYPPEDDA